MVTVHRKRPNNTLRTFGTLKMQGQEIIPPLPFKIWLSVIIRTDYCCKSVILDHVGDITLVKFNKSLHAFLHEIHLQIQGLFPWAYK